METLAVVLHTLRLRTLAALLNPVFLTMLNRIDILTVLALTVSPADSTLGVALAILGLTPGFGAFAFDFSLYFGFVGLQREQIIKFAFALVNRDIL